MLSPEFMSFSPRESASRFISPKTRKIDYNKLKLVCTMALVNMSFDKLKEFAIEIIKKTPDDRIPEEVLVLMKATQSMQYFKDLNKKNRHIRSNTHEKICSKIRYEKGKKGVTVMHYGDPATKFYIVLKGSVSIYVPRDYMVLQKEIEERKKNPQSTLSITVLQKIFQWRAKLKEFVDQYPLEESPINRKAFRKLYNKASIQLNPNIIKHLTKDFEIDHEYYFLNSIVKMQRVSTVAGGFQNKMGHIPENIDEEELNSPKSVEDDDDDELEMDYSANKASLDHENMQDFLKGFNEAERPILAKYQAFLGEVPLASLDEPESYFQDGVFKFHLVGIFGPGSIFGEVGLLMRKPRSASVICNCDIDFAVLTSEDYAEILEAVDKKEMETRMEFFIDNLFQELQPEVAIRLSYMFKKSKFMKGNFIYKQDEKANEVFLIKKGEIQIYKKIKESEQEKKIESVNEFIKNMYHKNENKIKQGKFITIQLSNLGAGQSFGEDDLLYNRNRAYNAVCYSNKVTLYYLPKSHFLKIITENKRIQFKILNNIKNKEKWHQTQIKNYYAKRHNKEENQSEMDQSEIFPIRRDISEIPELKNTSPPKKFNLTVFHKPTLSCMTSNTVISPFNSMTCSRPNSPNNVSKQKSQSPRSIFQTRGGLFSNIVIRKENPNKNIDTNLNGSISNIVKKNDKTLEELMRYSNNMNKGLQNTELYKILTEDEFETNKMAKIMYLYKSKRRNYSNSDSLDSNQKISLKTVINSIKKSNTTQESEQQNHYYNIRKFSLDPLSTRRSSTNNLNKNISNKKKKKTFEEIEKKNFSTANMLKVAFNNRGTIHMKKKSNLLIELLNRDHIKTARDKISSDTPVSNKSNFFNPISSRQIFFQKPQEKRKI